jgi:PAS domain S-box-containing protein
MNSLRKTKSQLSDELAALQKRVSELEQRRAALREDRLKLAIIDRAPFTVWAVTRERRIVLWSTAAERMYGFTKEEALGRSWLELFVSEEEREQASIDCRRIIDEDYVQRNFLAYDRAENGTGLALLTNCFRIWDEEGQQYLQAEVALEIPELKPIIEEHRSLRELSIKRQAEAERLLLLEKLRQLTTLISSSIFGTEGPKHVFGGIVDLVSGIVGRDLMSAIYLYDERKRQWSPEILGADNEIFRPVKSKLGLYVISTKSPLFIDSHRALPSDLDEFVEWIDANPSSYGKQDDPQELVAGPVKEPPFSYPLAVLPLVSAGEMVGVWFIAIPDLPEFSDSLQEALQLITEQVAFAANIARLIEDERKLNGLVAEKQDLLTRSLIAVDLVHRMNNLAGPIRGWAGLIAEELDPLDPRDRQILMYVGEIDAEVKDLLKSASEVEVQPPERDVDVNALLSAMLRNVRTQYYSVRTTSDLTPDVQKVRAIYSQLSDAIWNVVSNALDAMPEGGTLSVETKSILLGNKPWIEVVISDTGTGVSEEQRSHIFDINYSTKGAGRGYGLWRTKHVIEAIGGSVVLTESSAQTGTTFTVLLPTTA